MKAPPPPLPAAGPMDFRMTDFIRPTLSLPGGHNKLLLHSCCAPCSGEVMEAMLASGVDYTIFFYNPNIHPEREYELRKDENIRFAEKHGVPSSMPTTTPTTGSPAHAAWKTSPNAASAAPCASTCASSARRSTRTSMASR
jgi:hypothetical protein